MREAPARRQASARARSSTKGSLTGGEVRCTRKTSLRHGLEKLDGNVAVWIPIHDTGADPSAQLARYRRTQVRVGRAAENHELIVHARLGPGSHANGGTISARFVSSRARQ